jgi:uroporphyrinogen-III synthase
MRLLITRPEEDGGRLAERINALGHEPVLLPLLDISFRELPPLPLEGVQGLIATSRNALRGLRRNASFMEARALPVYCVGAATSDYAEQLGFSAIQTGAGTAKDLVPLIVRRARPEAGALLYLTGEQIAFDMAVALSGRRFDVVRVVVYSAEGNLAAAPLLADHLSAGLDGVLLMSPRTSQVFASLIETMPVTDIRGLTCYCYSQAVAKPLEHIKGMRLAIAARPTEADLLRLIGSGTVKAAAPHRSDELLGKS